MGKVGPDSEIVDDLAKPFLDLAEGLEAARLNGVPEETWEALLETNVFMWKYMSAQLPRMSNQGLPPDTRDLLKRITDFMNRASASLVGQRDDELIRKMVQLNLNMCDQILRLRGAK